MSKLIERLFGIELGGWDTSGQWDVEWTSLPGGGDTWLWGGLLLAGLFLGVGWLYRKDAGELRPAWRRLLVTLRVLVAVTLVLMLLEPVLVLERTEEVPSNLIVLRDESASMALSDRYGNDAESARAAQVLGLAGVAELSQKTRGELVDQVLEGGLLRELGADGDRHVRLHGFADHLDLDPRTGRETDRATGAFTAVGSAIEQSLAAYQGPPLAGVLLLTDGRSNSGPDPVRSAELARAARVPVHILAAGTEAVARNAKVLRLDAGEVAMVRDPFEVRVHLEARGLEGEQATVVLERALGEQWTEIGSQVVDLLEEGALAEVPFTLQEDQERDLQLRARVEDMGGETNREDNVATGSVRIVRRKIETLLIAGLAFPEVQFMINTLMRDETVELASWLQFADDLYEQKGNRTIQGLPRTLEQLEEYDCVILYDPDFGELPVGFARLLMEFVGQKAGGLIYIAGETSTQDLFDRKFDGGDSLLELLPVYREPGLFYSRIEQRRIAEREWKIEFTRPGLESDFFRFDPDPTRNARIQNNLPGMYWHFPVTRPKPGAVVLARHGDPRMRNQHGAHVVMATQLFGPGRSTFLALDSTYRWRFLGEQLFDGFWARLVGYSGRGKLLGGRSPLVVDTDRSSYTPGSVATLRARFRAGDAAGSASSVLQAQVEVGDAEPEAVMLTPDPEDPGLFTAQIQVSTSGEHLLRVWPSDRIQAGAEGAAHRFLVEFPDREIAQPAQDRATLTAIAERTGGRVFDLHEIEDIAGAFAIGRVALTHQDRQELWDAPIFFGTLLLLLFLEWVLRKRHRLV